MNEENVLEEEIEVDEAEEAEDVEVTDDPEEETDVADDGDDDFEYDEEGNIIIPDVEFDDETEDEDTAEEETPEEAPEEETPAAEEPAPTPEPEKPEEPEKPTEPDPRDDEIERLRVRIAKLESQSKDTLEKLGKNTDNILEGLAEVAAEVEGKSLTEYQAEQDKKAQEQYAKNALADQMYEIKAQNDLKELHAAYPETQKYKHLRELPTEVRDKFGKYRDLGLSPKEAYAAANPDGVRADVATAVKKQEMHNSKAHLQSSVPKGSKNTSVEMSKSELASWRELFPEMSDSEIKKIYKQSL